MDTREGGRFSSAAKAATPLAHVNKREGILLLVLAASSAVLLAVNFQAANWEWGGLIRAVVVALYLFVLCLVIVPLQQARKAHPRGFMAKLVAALGFIVVAFLFLDLVWPRWVNPHDTHWAVTTLVAVLCAAPAGWCGLYLLRKGELWS
ncbi:hypothetical protein [Corynebacterium phoceense]|uniref:hypothetical protein n=1 Tax=Corynebacterium phoceense TaxID=1686286 RepID=UPI002596C169|nr:hypothetical protein [uncultured Corynebacterium sp.]